jgi:membrane protein YdbS with pleckstrin-like domain
MTHDAGTPLCSDLSALADGKDYPLDPRYLTLQQQVGWIRFGVVALITLAAVAGAMSAARTLTFGAMLFALWFVVMCANAWWKQQRPRLAYKHSSYRVDAHGIQIRRGIFWKRAISVPRSRVQHTEVSQGPLERRHGLGTLAIHTAGVQHSIVLLNGLAYERALRLRDYLLIHETPDVV